MLTLKSFLRKRRALASALARTSRSKTQARNLLAFSSFYRDAFIYEYIGDVVNYTSLMKRMKDYANEGLRHFYFMMLQKDEVRGDMY